MLAKLQNIPRRVYVRYGLLCLPGTAVLVLVLAIVQHWVSIPIWLWMTLILFWIAKEAILFPFVWRSYDPAHAENFPTMIGKRGIARDRLAPSGYVRINGEIWMAETMNRAAPIEKDQTVQVRDIDGLKLFVVLDDARDR